MDYSYLFKPGKIGNVHVKNRIVFSPIGECMATSDGAVSEQALAYYTERAKGGAGIIIPGFFGVDFTPELSGRGSAIQHRIDHMRYIKDLSLLANSIHRYRSVLIIQLAHTGSQTNAAITDTIPVCVSDVDSEHILLMINRNKGPQRELTTDDIYTLIDRFIEAAVRCQIAGCDGVELHAAHVYLINQFLSPNLNHRTDEFGGNFENRFRFLISVMKGIRQKCGPDFIIGIRLVGREWVNGGLSDEDCREIAYSLETEGVDYISVSCGQAPVFSILLETKSHQGSRNEFVGNIKNTVNIPVMGNSSLRDPEFCENVLREGVMDYVLLGKALLCDPYWPQKTYEGRESEIRKCISCLEGCFANLLAGRYVTCALNPRTGEEFLQFPNPEKSKRVVVVGGGIAGMAATVTAAERGHEVILLEKTDKLGGQLNLASVPLNKDKIAMATKWFSSEVVRQGVEVHLNTEANTALIKSFAPDTVILSTGAVPIVPSFPGADEGIQSWALLEGSVPIPQSKNIVVIGGGAVGCEVALMLADKGNKVTVIEMLPEIAMGFEIFHRFDMLGDFNKYGILTHVSSVVKKITSGNVVFEEEGILNETKADTIIFALGQKPFNAVIGEELTKEGIDVITVGDAAKSEKIIGAVRSGHDAGLTV